MDSGEKWPMGYLAFMHSACFYVLLIFKIHRLMLVQKLFCHLYHPDFAYCYPLILTEFGDVVSMLVFLFTERKELHRIHNFSVWRTCGANNRLCLDLNDNIFLYQMVTETEGIGSILDLINKDRREDLNLAKNLGPNPFKSIV